MRYLIPALMLASPAVAHPTSLPHVHTMDWVVPVAMMLVFLVAVVARYRAVRTKK